MALRFQKVTATILFTDLINSTQLLEKVGDDRAQRVMAAHRRILSEAAAAHGGDVVKTMGDGLMVAFRSATDALLAALEMQEAARNPVAGELVQLQAGLNTGDLVIEGDDYFGLHVVIAERLSKLARAGQVICSGAVMGLLAGQSEFEFRELGAVELKGVATPVAAYEVVQPARSVIDRLARMPFVGRSREARQIELRLSQAMRGRGSVMLLTGEPGVGKTRVAEEVESLARDAGGCSAWARCYESDGHGPAPIASMARALCEVEDKNLVARLSEEDRAELGRVVPGLLPATGGHEAEGQPPGAGLSRLSEATSRLVAEASTQALVVLIFDDVQWAAIETATVFRRLARMAPQHRLLILATCRDGEVDPGRPIAETLAALPRESDVEVVALEGLGVAEVTTFVRIVAGDVSESVGAAIARHTGGNPYFIREVLLDLAAGEEDSQISSAAVERLSVTPGMRDVTLKRVNQLSASARRLLTTASAFESEFSVTVVQQLAGLDEAAALDAIDEALRAQLIRPGQGIDSYEFAHWIVGRALRDTMSPSRLARLHRDAAGCLVEAGAETRRIAYHLRNAGTAADPEVVTATCLKAGDEAARSLSYDEAIANFEAAVRSARTRNAGDAEADALGGLARAHAELGRREQALSNFQRAHELNRKTGRSAKLAEGLYYQARLHLFAMEFDQAQEYLLEAREVLFVDWDPADRERKRVLARVLEQMAQLVVRSGRFGNADDLESEAMSLAEELGDPNLLAETLFARGWIRLQRLEVDQSIEDLSRYRAVASANRYLLQDLVGAIRGGVALVLRGDLARAREWVEPAQVECERSRRTRDEAYSCIPLSAVALLMGDVATVDEQTSRGLGPGGLADPFVPNALIPTRACAAWLRGDSTGALALIDPLLTPEERAGRPRPIVTGFGYQALLRALNGDIGSSRLMAQAMAEQIRPRPAELRTIPTYAILAELALFLREPALAGPVVDSIAAARQRGLRVTPGWPMFVSRLLGGIAGLRGHLGTARALLEEALAEARASGAMVEEVLTEFELARLDGDHGGRRLRRGLEIAEALNLPGLQRRAEAPTIASVQ